MPTIFLPTSQRYRLLAFWLVVNVAGWWLAWGFFFVTGNYLVGSNSHLPEIFFYFLYFVAGGILGLVQFQALKDRFGLSALEWIMASALGFSLGMTAMALTNLLDLYIHSGILFRFAFEWDQFLGAIIFALVVGCCQAIVWRHSSYQSLRWLLTAGLGWFLGLILSEIASFRLIEPGSGFGSLLVFLVVVPVVASLFTGFAINSITARPVTTIIVE